MTEKYRLKYLDYTRYDVIAPHGILDLFQDIAGKHANTYGMSFEEMYQKNQIWVLLRIKYKVIKEISLYSNVEVTTWPKKKGLVDFDRETIIKDDNGEVCIVGISKWLILDLNTRKIIPARHIDYTPNTSEDTNFENEKFDKLNDFDVKGLPCFNQTIEFCDTDHNGHANNAKYSSMVLNALCLKEDEKIDTFEINYVNESYFKDVLNIYHYKENKEYFVKATCNDKTIFLCKIGIK